MKKVISLALCMAMLFSMCLVVSAEVSFSDLPSGHWAYSYVSTLVADGTINGFEDGTFRPDATVSRAEFVKMIGKGATISPVVFKDITGHWGYDYIMYSGLDGDSNGNFNPDVPITRADVANLVWARNGSVTGVKVPAMITNQGANAEAVAWVYAYGVMTGDDGINLRLNDTLTRAEAAALIIKARTVSAERDFISGIDEKVYETMFNSSKLFDRPYDANAKITNDELALAVARLASEEYTVTYTRVPNVSKYEGENAANINILASVIGEENNNAAFGAKNSTVQDSVAALMYGTLKQSKKGQSYGDKSPLYMGVSSGLTENEQIMLAYAYKKGITLYAGGQINPSNEITMKELACILFQLDGGIAGFETFDMVGDKTRGADGETLKNVDAYPTNAADYKTILSNVPVNVYGVAFTNLQGKPVDAYNFVREYKVVLVQMLEILRDKAKNNGAELTLTYTPSLVADNGNGYTMRIHVAVNELEGTANLSDLLGLTNSANVQVTKGSKLYVDIVTGQELSQMDMPVDKMAIDKLVYTY